MLKNQYARKCAIENETALCYYEMKNRKTGNTYMGYAYYEYIKDGGLSRGSYLVGNGEIPDDVITDTAHRDKVIVTDMGISDGYVVSSCHMEPVRPIPTVDNWFENVYNAYGKKEMYE